MAVTKIKAIRGSVAQAINLRDLRTERDRLTAEQAVFYAERDKLKNQIKEIETVKRNVDSILGNNDHDIQRAATI